MADAKRSSVTYISDFLAKRNAAKTPPDVVDLSFLLQEEDTFVFLPMETPAQPIDTVFVPTVSYSFSDEDYQLIIDEVRE